jgi:hypothetical protein
VRSVIVEFDLKGQVALNSAGTPVEIVKGQQRDRDPSMSLKAGPMNFEIASLQFQIHLSNVVCSWSVKNQGNQAVELLFDQMTSAATGKSTPTKPSHTFWGAVRGSPSGNANFMLRPLVIAPGATADVSLSGNLGAAYPNGRLFNAQWDSEGGITESGVGKQLVARLPIRRAGVESVLEFTLEVAKEYTRFSYY